MFKRLLYLVYCVFLLSLILPDAAEAELVGWNQVVRSFVVCTLGRLCLSSEGLFLRLFAQFPHKRGDFVINIRAAVKRTAINNDAETEKKNQGLQTRGQFADIGRYETIRVQGVVELPGFSAFADENRQHGGIILDKLTSGLIICAFNSL